MSLLVIVLVSLVIINSVSAQTLGVLGEIQSTGTVFIGSSTGKWTPAASTYPLLKDTGIKTEDGSASIFFKEGSRIDLSRDTITSLNGDAPDFAIHLAKGVIAFSITSTSSLSVSTPSASIVVNGKDGIVQKVGYEKPTRILGVISATEQGTEVRNISGKIVINSSSTGQKILSSGESLFIGKDSTFKAYKTQHVVGGGTAAGLSGEVAGLVTTVIGGTSIYIYDQNHPSRNASPYIP